MDKLTKLPQGLSFSAEQFNSLFPFYFLLNRDGQIRAFGLGLQKLLNLDGSQSFSSVFTVERPQLPLSDQNLISLLHQAVIIRSVTRPEIRLRGQLESMPDDQLLFVGAPW